MRVYLRGMETGSSESQAGLCQACDHARVIVSGKGSTFWLCQAAADTPGLERYPRLPVLACPAYTPGERR